MRFQEGQLVAGHVELRDRPQAAVAQDVAIVASLGEVLETLLNRVVLVALLDLDEDRRPAGEHGVGTAKDGRARDPPRRT
jgi:hypothetical protein